MSLFRLLAFVLAVLPATSMDRAAAQGEPAMVPLKLYWSAARGDNFTTATAQGERNAIAAGYAFARIEGYIFATPRSGTVPLKLYWSAARGDNFTTATAEGERDAIAAGYTFARIEGYIYPTPQTGTVPLKLFWSDARRDNFTTATDIGKSHAYAASYRFARIEGYVFPAQPSGPPPLPPTIRAEAPQGRAAAPAPETPQQLGAPAASAPAPAVTLPPVEMPQRLGAATAPAATAVIAPPLTKSVTPPPPPAAVAPALPPAVAALPPATAADPGRRVALVIGNSSYTAVPKLVNPPRDAETVAAALRRAGFQSVVTATDLTRERLIAALLAFGREADRADWGLVYYAGHGIEIGGVNYLIPIDAKLGSDRDVELEAIPLNQVLRSVERARKLRLVLLDACRDNPFVGQMRRTLATRSVGRGLASVEPEAGTLVVYAAKHGETALDGDGANSPFATAFVRNIATPGLEVRRLFDLVRDDVLDATQRQQQPYSYGSLPGREDYYFLAR